MSTPAPHIAVALSGGVDSSVAAYLLKKEGYRVSGVYIRGWQPPFWHCTIPKERASALRVCASLGIPFRTLVAEEEYKRDVVQAFLKEYADGYVPNPDVLCNRVIKFGLFYEYAKKAGFDGIATGHYARREGDKLCTSVDTEKDQTYFLWTLTPFILQFLHFPLSSYTKREVRSIAKKARLHTATKKDSQGICFLGDGGMDDFLTRSLKLKQGVVVDTHGTPIGVHRGVTLYTLGQRHGFTITTKDAYRKPLFVIERRVQTNTLVVSDTPLHLYEKGVTVFLRECSWTHIPPSTGEALLARGRHRGAYTPSTYHDSSVTIKKPTMLYTKGQSLVLYRGEECLGGGIVESVTPFS